MPSFSKFSIVAGPNKSLPTRATMNTSAPQRRAATAWFAPLPPNPRSNFWPKMVSPGFGNRSVNVVRSMLALPTTAMRGRRGMVYLREPENAESIWGPRLCQRAALLTTRGCPPHLWRAYKEEYSYTLCASHNTLRRKDVHAFEFEHCAADDDH